MLDAITASQLALQFDQLKLQSVSQNVSNMNTPGFKKQVLEHQGFDTHLAPSMNSVAQELQRSQIKTQGGFNQTHTPTDIALTGDGYFQVQGDHGLFYTRRGDFAINSQGELTTATGETLLGKGGTLKVDGKQFSIDKEGGLFMDHQKVDQLQIVQFSQPHLLNYVGNGLYQTEESPTPVNSAHVLQGYLEKSNVTSIDEMMDILKTSRHFEASQRVLRMSDKLISAAINQLGESNV